MVDDVSSLDEVRTLGLEYVPEGLGIQVHNRKPTAL